MFVLHFDKSVSDLKSRIVYYFNSFSFLKCTLDWNSAQTYIPIVNEIC